MSNYPISPPTQNYPANNYPPYVNQPQPNQPGNFSTSTGYPYPPQQQNQPGNFSPSTGYPYPPQQQNMNVNMGEFPGNTGYPNTGGMPQPGMYPPGMPQPGMPQPGMPHPGMQEPGVCPPGMLQPGVTPGYNPGVNPTAPVPDPIPGYEGLSYDNAILPPPVIDAWQPDPDSQKPLPDLPTLTEEEVQEAVIQYSSEHCCYGSKVGREMAVREILMMSAFHYKLETFTEKRESAYIYEPYTGQAIDGPQNGPPPPPWSIAIQASQPFKDGKSKLEVPHTASVKPCHTCVGNGRVRCESCQGNGRKSCTWCKGKGRVKRFENYEPCDSCSGTGWDRCFKCEGTGQTKCSTCNGKANLKGFVELTVTWTNHAENFISETSNMPKELVLNVTGQVAYDEENPRVYPLTHVADRSVANASQDLVNKHQTAFANERILKQRQCLRVIPISQVRYEWKDKADEFFVYGYEHKVYFKKYPQKCCCCTII